MLDYVDVPIVANVLNDIPPTTVPTKATKEGDKKHTSKPSVSLAVLSTLLFSSTIPSTPTSPAPTHNAKGTSLLTSHQPLALNVMSTAFRRFIFRVGPVFSIQDRVEEVLFWKKGWKVGAFWMSLWAFLCYFPRLFLAVPQVIFIAYTTHKSLFPTSQPSQHSPIATQSQPPPSPTTPTSGGNVPPPPDQDWQANLQAIQNLMAFYSDMYDQAVSSPLAHELTNPPPYSALAPPTTPEPESLSMRTLTIALFALPVAPLLSFIIPIQVLLLVAGWSVICAGHPFVRERASRVWNSVNDTMYVS